MATAAAAAPVVTAAPAVSASTVTEANVSSSIETTPSLSLSSIGFGNMFTGAGTATRGPPPVAATEKSTTDGPEKLRLLIASTHCQQVTGYAKVSHGILTELAKESSWLDVTHFGFQRLPKVPTEFRPLPSTITQLDAAAMERPGGQPQGGFAFSALPDVIRQKKPHVVLIYNDLAVVNQYINAINTAGLPRTFKLWVYADQVYNIQSQMYLDLLNRDVDRIFAFSAGWKKCLKDQGITRPIDVIPHGFTKSQFYSIPKELARQQIMLPKDIFLFLNLNRNQPRKRYDILLMAFVELIVKYPTKPLFLLCICDKGDQQGGWWLFEIFARELKLRGVPVEQFGNRLVNGMIGGESALPESSQELLVTDDIAGTLCQAVKHVHASRGNFHLDVALSQGACRQRYFPIANPVLVDFVGCHGLIVREWADRVRQWKRHMMSGFK